MAQAVPRDLALKICHEIRQENRRKWFSLAAVCCNLCVRMARNNMPGLIEMRDNCTGCRNVVKRYSRQYILPEIVD